MNSENQMAETKLTTPKESNCQFIALDKLRAFKFHIFKPREDESLEKIVASVKLNGIIHPIVARPIADSNDLEIISGHSRVEAARRAGMTEVPVVVRDLDDDTAIMFANESNIAQRTFSEWFPSEKANSIYQYYTAHRNQGKRNDLTSSSSGDNHQRSEDYTRAKTALIYGVKENIIRLYFEIYSLSDDLKEKLDHRIFGTTAAQHLSRISLKGQDILTSVLEATPEISAISVANAKKVRQALDGYAGRDENEELQAKTEIRKILVRESDVPETEDSEPSIKIIEMETEQYEQLFIGMSPDDVILEIIAAVQQYQKNIFAPITRDRQ